MATFLNAIEILNTLGFYSYIFPFILIFAITYGLLSTIKPVGDDVRVNLIISMVMGFLFISFSTAVDFINMFLPFIMIIFVVFLFILMAFKFGGVPEESIINTLKHPIGYGTIIAFIILAMVVTITNTQFMPDMFDPLNESEISPAGFALTPEAQSKQIIQTLFHPTLVGVMIMFITFAVTVYMITRKP